MNKHEVTVNGQKLKRVSQNRKYKFAIVCSAPAHSSEPDRFWAQWASRRDLAEKAAEQVRRQGFVEFVEIVPVGGSVKIRGKFRNEIKVELPEWQGFCSHRPANRKLAAALIIRYGDGREPHVYQWYAELSVALSAACDFVGNRGFKPEHVVVSEVIGEA